MLMRPIQFSHTHSCLSHSFIIFMGETIKNKIEHMLTNALSIDTYNACAHQHIFVSVYFFYGLLSSSSLSAPLIYIKLWTCQSQPNNKKQQKIKIKENKMQTLCADLHYIRREKWNRKINMKSLRVAKKERKNHQQRRRKNKKFIKKTCID